MILMNHLEMNEFKPQRNKGTKAQSATTGGTPVAPLLVSRHSIRHLSILLPLALIPMPFALYLTYGIVGKDDGKQ